MNGREGQKRWKRNKGWLEEDEEGKKTREDWKRR
jgi:hypothetical protein